jgi:hypothetical protein
VAARTGGLRILKLFDFVVKLVAAVGMMALTTNRTGTHFLVARLEKCGAIL